METGIAMNRKRIFVLMTVACMLICMIALITSCGSKNEPVDSGEPAAEAGSDELKQEPEPDKEAEPEVEKENEFPKAMYVNTEEGLILRKEPGTENDAVYLLSYGQEIQVDETKDGWAHTTVDGNTGWCYMEYLTTDKESIKTEEESNDADFDPNKLVEPTNNAEQGYHAYVNSEDGLNMRYGPGTEYGIIEGIPDKTEITELGWEEGWIYILYNDNYGWVDSKYVLMQGGREKPVIYLYPVRTMDVNVRVRLNDGWFTESIPAGSGDWNVTASPDGRLTDKATGETYDYIYWESSAGTDYDWSKGYVVKGSESEQFLLRILPAMGLSKKEYTEFIDYWLPRLQKNEYNLITFQTVCYTDAVRMDISPEPDSVLRVFMVFKAVDGAAPVAAPEIHPFERNGFTVVEWGGAEVSD